MIFNGYDTPKKIAEPLLSEHSGKRYNRKKLRVTVVCLPASYGS